MTATTQAACLAGDSGAQAARLARILGETPLDGARCLEIGPLHRPLLPKGRHDVVYLDYLTADELRRKYANDPQIAGAIVDVDLTMAQLAGRVDSLRGMFDVIVASHVAEHVPDLIGWLVGKSALLSANGRLILVVPDKRFTFDARRRLTVFDDVERAHRDRRIRPGLDCVIDHMANAVSVEPVELWSDYRVLEKATRIHTEAHIISAIDDYRNGGYREVHCWTFMPWSFLRLLADVNRRHRLGLVPAYVSSTTRPQIDFVVHLVPSLDSDSAAVQCEAEADLALETAQFPPNYQRVTSHGGGDTAGILGAGPRTPAPDIKMQVRHSGLQFASAETTAAFGFILVGGVARGGTTIVAAILSVLGGRLPAGCRPNREPPVVCDPDALGTLVGLFGWERRSAHIARVISSLCEEAEKPGRLVWKDPQLAFYVEIALAAVQDPVLVVVTRDPFTALVSEAYTHGGVIDQDESSAERFATEIARIRRSFQLLSDAALVSGRRSFFLSYEKLLNYPARAIRELAEAVGLPASADAISSAAAMVMPEAKLPLPS